MALYQNGDELAHKVDACFDKVHSPGTAAPYSGIYICANCRDEYACNAGDPLPPQNHRQHNPSTGAIRWKLLIQTQNGPS
ncbi:MULTISPECIES: protein L [Chelativorans]|uniref:protein L n=1 Tax=Chelativorans TaxID=449972 RepID=UPI001356F756|nr:MULTISPECIES: protein L [Chelativorans]